MEEPYNIRPASEDPLGDPADQEDARQGIRPASEDPLGDPADQQGWPQGVRPASEDPLGDPADQEMMYQYDQAQADPAFGHVQQEYIRHMPQDRFEQATSRALRDMPDDEQDGLAGSLLGALQNRGFQLGDIGQMLGMGEPQVGQVRQQGLAQLIGWARQNAPDVVDELTSKHGGFVRSMGGNVLSGLLGNLAGRFLGGGDDRDRGA